MTDDINPRRLADDITNQVIQALRPAPGAADDIVQIIPTTDRWTAVYKTDAEYVDELGKEFRVPVVGFALQRDGKVVALDVDDDGAIAPTAPNLDRLERDDR